MSRSIITIRDQVAQLGEATVKGKALDHNVIEVLCALVAELAENCKQLEERIAKLEG